MISPLGSRLVVKIVKDGPSTTKGGIIIADMRAPQSVKAEVLSAGPECKLVKANDVVLIAQFSLTEARENATEDTLICPEEDVLAVIVPDKAAE